MNKYEKIDEDILILTDKYLRLDEVLPFEEGKYVELDLGCGKGGFTIALAERYPERLILAADIMLGRLRKVHKKLVKAGTDKGVKLLRVEANMLLARLLPDASIDRLHILCPDPWPKLRHSGKRLLSSQLTAFLARVLKKDGLFHFSTDDPEYMQAVETLIASSGFFKEESLEFLADVADVKTEFERDWLAIGRTVPHKLWRLK